MEKHIGIILRIPTQRQRSLVLVDKKLGKILGITPNIFLQRGGLVAYNPRRQGNAWILDSLEVLFTPCDLARSDIMFLHHTLEIVYYFLPIGACARGVVELFIEMYEKYVDLSGMHKKSIIFKLLVVLGVYPEQMIMRVSYFNQLATESIDTIAQAILDLGIEKDLDQWLHSCITGHSHAKYFKTLATYQ